MSKEKLISVVFLCNDGDHGTFTGRFEAVRIGDDLIGLMPAYHPWRSYKLAFDFTEQARNGGFGPGEVKGTIKVSRKTYPVYGYKYGWGNWCWDLVMMRAVNVCELINQLKKTGSFCADDAADYFFDKFEEDDFVFSLDDQELVDLFNEYGYSKP